MIKKLSQMELGEKGVILQNLSAEPIKSRLVSMGIVKGSTIEVRDQTLRKQTLSVIVCQTDVALRSEEADLVMVEVQ